MSAARDMIEQFGIEAEDRILVLSLSEPELIRQLSAAVSRGGIACLGERDEVYDARREFRELRNVMCHPGPPHDIAFEDGFFTKVLDPAGGHERPAVVAAEVARVLAAGGRAFLSGAVPEILTGAGLVVERRMKGFTIVRRPDDPAGRGPPLEFPILR